MYKKKIVRSESLGWSNLNALLVDSSWKYKETILFILDDEK